MLNETHTNCFAWALIPNNTAHLLLPKGLTPISGVMRRLLTGYDVQFNRASWQFFSESIPQGQKGMPMKGTLLEDIPVELPEEVFDTICISENVKIERIVSRGHASPEGFWYDQDKSEFILIVQGSAGLKIEKECDIVVLNTGDYLNIGAHVKHRVEWTDPACDTIWLAVHY